MNPRGYAQAYRNTAIDTAPEPAPAQKVALLLAGTIERLHHADALIGSHEYAAKAESISSALTIVQTLRHSLDHEAGGQLAERLAAIYDYVALRMVEANAHNDRAPLQEVIQLLQPLAGAWASLPQTETNTAGANSG